MSTATTTTKVAKALSGKLALVTGGSGTIGCAIATALTEQGASVVITGRNYDRLEKAKEKILSSISSTSSDGDNVVHCISSDVTNETSVQELFSKIDDISTNTTTTTTGNNDIGLDLLINNAGTMVPGETIDLSYNDFHNVLNVNVLGPFLCSREAIKRMKNKSIDGSSSSSSSSSRGGGRIINIGSISGDVPRPNSAPYTTSKFALIGLTKSLALDCRQYNISVGMIHPGNVQSELLTQEEIAARQHEGFLQPSDVANCVVTMSSLPYSSTIYEMTVIPTQQPYVGRG